MMISLNHDSLQSSSECRTAGSPTPLRNSHFWTPLLPNLLPRLLNREQFGRMALPKETSSPLVNRVKSDWFENMKENIRNTANSQWRIPSLDLLIVLFLMQPRIPLSFLPTRTHCWLRDSLLSTSTPRSFSTELLPSRSAPGCAGPWGYCCPGAGPCTCLC